VLLIDGYNLLKSAIRPDLGVPDSLTPASEVVWLARAVARRPRFQQDQALVCFDGTPSRDVVQHQGVARVDELALRVGDVHMVYAGPGREADDLIEMLIEKAGRPWDCTVVSSDRRLWRAATHGGASALRSEEFARLLPGRQEKSGPGEDGLSPDEVEHWMRVFDGERPVDPKAAAAETVNENDEPLSGDEAPYVLDPLIREAIKEWRGRLRPDDLSMKRWLDEHPPS